MTRDTKELAGKPPTKITKQQKDAPMLKVVIRCLPPTLTAEEFLKLVEPLTGHDYFAFVKADSSLGQYACSRAYIDFLQQSDVVTFRDRWDGFPFKDTSGKEYPAVVELSPYQKIPKKSNRKPDTRCGTIEEDDDYQRFLEALTAEIEPLPSAEAYLEELEAKQRAAATARVTTPLIDFLKKKRIERIKAREKVREERRQKDKERKRQREEEKRRQDRDRKKKEERERRERDMKHKKEETAAKSEGDKKTRDREKNREEDRKKGRELEKRDSQIKLLKKADKDSKVEPEDRTKQGRGGKDVEHARGRSDAEGKKPENVRSQENLARDKERSSAGRDRNSYSKSINDRRKPSSGRDTRERDRGGGRDRYGDRDRDRRPPSKASSQESLQKFAGKSQSRDKLDGRDGQRFGDERKEKDGGKKTTEEARKEEERARELRRDERAKIRNKDRPDMARYQPGQRSWSTRPARKEDGSDSARTSPTSSEGDKSKAEAKKPGDSGDSKQAGEKRPTAAKKYEPQPRNNIGRPSGTKDEGTGRKDEGKQDQRAADRSRDRGVGRGYREERSNRNRHRQDDARRKAEEVKSPRKKD